MKKVILSLLMVAGVSAAFAQGTVTFNTFNGGNSALGQTFKSPLTGGGGPGTAFYGQLWWSDTSTSQATFVPVGTPTKFDSVQPTYVLGGSVTIPGHDAGTAVFLEMRVWDTAAGTSWTGAGLNVDGTQGATVAQLTQYGISAIKSRNLGGIDTGGNPFAPQTFSTFANLTLTPVPEPSTIALAGLGIASLLVLRRKK